MQESQAIADEVRSVLIETLAISATRAEAFHMDTPLFGAVPELDSMAVATVLTAIEDRLGIFIDDDDVDAETFETFGNLVAFTAGKIARRDG